MGLEKIKRSPLLKLFLGNRCKNLYLFVVNLILNAFSALLEGSSFGFILLAFATFDDKPLNLQNICVLKHFNLSFLTELSKQELFLLFILTGLGLQILKSSLAFMATQFIMKITLDIQKTAQLTIYKRILYFTFPCVSRYQVGDLVEYARIPSTFLPGFMNSFNQLIISTFISIVLIVILTFISLPLTIATTIAFTTFIFFQKVIVRKTQNQSIYYSKNIMELSSQTVQNLNGIRLVHTCHFQEELIKKIKNILINTIDSNRKTTVLMNALTSINEIGGLGIVSLILLMGFWLLNPNEIGIMPILLTFLTITYRLSTKLQAAISSLNIMAGGLGPLLRLEEILSDKDKEFIPQDGKEFSGLSDKIELKNISLHYPSKKEEALSDISFLIKKGSVTALIGSSGSGKSSLLDLLVRLYEPTEGYVFVDGQSIKDYSLHTWRKHLGVVSQDAFIFNDTIEENIKFGNENCSIPIEEAAEKAGAHEFIAKLPLGYKTVVGEKGFRLSGGERQRLTLARALLRDPQILILDEATSHLDSHSEQIIQKSLEKLRGQKTIILVAHRLSTVAWADSILVLDKGKLVESGSHEELLKQEGKYANFWKIQSKKHQN